jgi:Fe2+ or Zn2+ uptake regulation protein
MTCSDFYASLLRAGGVRSTSQRLAILHTLHHSGGHLVATEVFARAVQELPSLTEPTVYRTLDFLCERGFVRATHSGGGRLEYELAGEMHHHIVCKECGATRDFPHDQFQAIYDHLEAQTGYRLTEHHLTLWGLCPNCKP